MNKVILLFFFFSGFSACSLDKETQNPDQPIEDEKREYADYIFQYSMVDALLAGVYEGSMTIEELKSKGDMGLGTFNQVNGELIMHEGNVYRMKSDGRIETVADKVKTPLAFVKFFRPDTVFHLSGEKISYEDFEHFIRTTLNPNEMYAIRISGSFQTLHARAPEPAQKPYPPLAEHLATHQKEFDLVETKGTAVGFYLPEYTVRMNVPGFHLHYLSEDKKNGGHILNFISDDLKIEADRAEGLILQNLDTPEFRKADLLKDRQKETLKVERGR